MFKGSFTFWEFSKCLALPTDGGKNNRSSRRQGNFAGTLTIIQKVALP
jgi:hypothetical protein